MWVRACCCVAAASAGVKRRRGPYSPRRYLYTPIKAHVLYGHLFLAFGDCDSSLDTQSFWVGPRRRGCSGSSSGNSTGSGAADSSLGGGRGGGDGNGGGGGGGDESVGAASLNAEGLLGRVAQRGVVMYTSGNDLVGALAFIPLPDDYHGSDFGVDDCTSSRSNGSTSSSSSGKWSLAEENLMHSMAVVHAMDAFRDVVLAAQDGMKWLDFDVRWSHGVGLPGGVSSQLWLLPCVCVLCVICVFCCISVCMRPWLPSVSLLLPPSPPFDLHSVVFAASNTLL